MARRRQVWVLLALLALVVVAKLGQQGYRWYAYADERGVLQRLRGDLEEAGLAVVRTRLRADSLRAEVEGRDRELERARDGLALYDRHARDGALPVDLYRSYNGELEGYNREVEARNRVLDRWSEAQRENRRAVEHYNTVADSLRGLAEGIGERFYRIPTPAEIAAERGVRPQS